jgi:hypothetical protein
MIKHLYFTRYLRSFFFLTQSEVTMILVKIADSFSIIIYINKRDLLAFLIYIYINHLEVMNSLRGEKDKFQLKRCSFPLLTFGDRHVLWCTACQIKGNFSTCCYFFNVITSEIRNNNYENHSYNWGFSNWIIKIYMFFLWLIKFMCKITLPKRWRRMNGVVIYIYIYIYI